MIFWIGIVQKPRGYCSLLFFAVLQQPTQAFWAPNTHEWEIYSSRI
jgi:hypothetical protein